MEEIDKNRSMAIAAQMMAVLFYRVCEVKEDSEDVVNNIAEYLKPLGVDEMGFIMHIMIALMEHADEIKAHMDVSSINKKIGGIVLNGKGLIPGVNEPVEALLEMIYPQFEIIGKKENGNSEADGTGEDGQRGRQDSGT